MLGNTFLAGLTAITLKTPLRTLLAVDSSVLDFAVTQFEESETAGITFISLFTLIARDVASGALHTTPNRVLEVSRHAVVTGVWAPTFVASFWALLANFSLFNVSEETVFAFDVASFSGDSDATLAWLNNVINGTDYDVLLEVFCYDRGVNGDILRRSGRGRFSLWLAVTRISSWGGFLGLSRGGRSRGRCSGLGTLGIY